MTIGYFRQLIKINNSRLFFFRDCYQCSIDVGCYRIISILGLSIDYAGINKIEFQIQWIKYLPFSFKEVQYLETFSNESFSCLLALIIQFRKIVNKIKNLPQRIRKSFAHRYISLLHVSDLTDP